MENLLIEYQPHTGYYMAYDAMTGKSIQTFTSNELYDYLKRAYGSDLHGTTALNQMIIPNANAYGYTFENKRYGKTAVGITKSASLEIERMGQLFEEIKKSTKTKNNIHPRPKLKKWVKVVMGSTVLAGTISGAMVIKNNQGPDFDVPDAAETVFENVEEYTEHNPNASRTEALSQLYSDDNMEEKIALDQVAITIKTAEKEYEEGKITKEKAEQQVANAEKIIEDLNKQVQLQMEEQGGKTR